jgi:hypothetical protein
MRQADMFFDNTTNMIIAEVCIARLTHKAHRGSAVLYVAFPVYCVMLLFRFYLDEIVEAHDLISIQNNK